MADLRGLVAGRRFREDLFHRLDVLRLTIPPLRDREGDITLLARHFVREFGIACGRTEIDLSPDALARMERNAWPGNVREMQGVLQRAVLMNAGTMLDSESLDLPDSDLPDNDRPCSREEVAAKPYGGFTGTLKAAKASAIRRFEREYLSSCSRAAQEM